MATAQVIYETPDASKHAAHWHAAYTTARHEKVVAQQLTERRVETFLPLYRSLHRWKDRRKLVELPLFPSYVFVRISPRDKLRVLQVSGVVHLVSFNGQLAELPETEINALRNGLEHDVYAEPYPYLRVGRRVRVVRGAMAGTEGLLVRKKDKYRVVISIDVLMRSVAVEIDGGDLQAVGS